ncbi:MAG: hypothetical protein ACTTKL_06535 [Treponema sp.]
MAAVNSVGDFIRSVFPSTVNKNGKVFKALLADDTGGGTVETTFRDIEETRKAWAKDGSVYSQDGETCGRLILDLKDLIVRRPLRVCLSPNSQKNSGKEQGAYTDIKC